MHALKLNGGHFLLIGPMNQWWVRAHSLVTQERSEYLGHLCLLTLLGFLMYPFIAKSEIGKDLLGGIFADCWILLKSG